MKKRQRRTNGIPNLKLDLLATNLNDFASKLNTDCVTGILFDCDNEIPPKDNKMVKPRKKKKGSDDEKRGKADTCSQ